MRPQPFLRIFVSPAALCALGFLAAMGTVLQYSLRAHVPGSLEPGGLTFDNFIALLKPLYARVFLDTVGICFLTAACTLMVAYPVAYALVHAQNRLIKAAILVIAVTSASCASVRHIRESSPWRQRLHQFRAASSWASSTGRFRSCSRPSAWSPHSCT